MSLSRPVKFPLLKLPWLCMKCVLHNSDEFILIYFATISNRTRRIVRSSNYPLKEIDVYPNGSKQIGLGHQKYWQFTCHMYEDGVSLVLQRNYLPLRTRQNFEFWMGPYLQSCTTGDTPNALKMGIEFMIDVFGCTVRYICVAGNELSELFGLGISSAKVLRIDGHEPVNLTDLKYLLENVKVTEKYVIYAQIPKAFYCEPQTFKCQQLFFFGEHSADWVTLELLCLFDVSQLNFSYHRFSVENIITYVTQWFNSENRKLEYLHIDFNKPISLEDFKIDHLNPMPFCEKRRSRRALHKSWPQTDMSKGKDILRQDGLLATLYAYPSSIFFYVWHKRFSDAI
ncbi:unnamed protein product [Caenorhabditis brenneri]